MTRDELRLIEFALPALTRDQALDMSLDEIISRGIMARGMPGAPPKASSGDAAGLGGTGGSPDGGGSDRTAGWRFG